MSKALTYTRKNLSHEIRSRLSRNDSLPHRIASILVFDAIKKSCLTNDLSTDRVATSLAMLEYFHESRRWIMDMDDTPPATDLGGGWAASFGCGFCLDLLGIDRDAFVSGVSLMWRERDDKIKDAIKGLRSKHRSDVKKSQSAKMSRRPPRGPAYKGEKRLRATKLAMETLNLSRGWPNG